MPVFVGSESDEIHSIFDWLHGQRQPTPERYMRGMAFLELLWQQTVPGLAFKVVHDEPGQLPGKSTRTAMALFAALPHHPIAQKWFVEHIRNAVVHCTAAADAITVVDDSIHFYQAKELSEDLGLQIFDRLSLTQQRDFAELYAGRDARRAFADFVKFEVIAAMTHPDVDHLRGLSELIGRLPQAHSPTVFIAKTVESARPGGGDSPDDGGWSDEWNDRRIELIDKEIQGDITMEGRVELAGLQRKAVAYRDRVAPLRIEGATRLHRQLLEMKHQREGGS